MDKSREELEKEYAEATAKLEQYQHRGQRYENRIRYYTQGERKKRNHRLITRGGARHERKGLFSFDGKGLFPAGSCRPGEPSH